MDYSYTCTNQVIHSSVYKLASHMVLMLSWHASSLVPACRNCKCMVCAEGRGLGWQDN